MSKTSEATDDLKHESPRNSETKDDGVKTDDGKESDENGEVNSGKDEKNTAKQENSVGQIEQDENEESLENDDDKSKKKSQKYPFQIFFILTNEFCERFTFYGLRTILQLFLSQELEYSENVSTIIYHIFQVVAYFTPLFGAIIADAWLGRFWTIFYMSILYAVGNVVLSSGAALTDKNKMAAVSFPGLFVIGIGTGGIKPCVSAFGGDQFREDQVKERLHFFSLFYFMINAGSVISTFLTPFLREDVHCLGRDSCFPLAFGVPGLLMVVALIIFVLGKPFYIMKPVRGSVFFDVFKCIGHALSRKIKNKGEKKDHWLDYAEDKYNKKQIEDIKALLNVMKIFIPCPIFWCLFEQQGSTWVTQATKMDGTVKGFVIKPDQMQVVNSIFILILIPLFDKIVYPLLAKCNLLKKPLQRMTTGLFLAALSFVMAGLLELKLEETVPKLPEKGTTEIRFINMSPCKIKITGAQTKFLNEFEMNQTSTLNQTMSSLSWYFEPSACDVKSGVSKTFTTNGTLETILITESGKNLDVMMTNDTRAKPKSGEPQVRIIFSIEFAFAKGSNGHFVLQGTAKKNIIPNTLSGDSKSGMTEYFPLQPGRYKIFIPGNDVSVGEHNFAVGGTYIVFIYQDQKKKVSKFSVDETVKHNSVHMLLQVPSLVVVTTAEVFFSITGLEFAYSQSPEDLKSVVQAAWLLTSAFGNLITVIILVAVGELTKQSLQFFIFAGIMVVDAFVFAILAYFYIYVNVREDLE